MSDTPEAVESLADLLRAHRLQGGSYIGTGHGEMGLGKVWCTCGEAIEFDWYESDAVDAHDLHFAAVLGEREARDRAQQRAEGAAEALADLDERCANAERGLAELQADRASDRREQLQNKAIGVGLVRSYIFDAQRTYRASRTATPEGGSRG